MLIPRRRDFSLLQESRRFLPVTPSSYKQCGQRPSAKKAIRCCAFMLILRGRRVGGMDQEGLSMGKVTSMLVPWPMVELILAVPPSRRARS